MEGSSHHSRSHSRSYSHHSRSHSKAQVFSGPAATFSGSKKPPLFPGNAGNGGFFTTSYDDVFGGPPTFATLAPRAEDYSEIFGAFRSSSASRASSIPLLDLPAVADIDAGASFLDYSEVFGGFDAVDFAVPYDELFRPFDAGDCSSDEAWTPVGSESLSDDSDPFACSEKSQCFSDGNSHQSVDGKQFNVSYHQVNPGSSTSVPNMTHVAQLNVVPGYTCVVDEPRSVTETGKERFCSTIDDDIILSVEPSPFMSQKHADKNMSQISCDDAALRSSNGDHKPGRGRSASMGTVNLTSSSVSDINHRTETCDLPPPFRPPPVQAGRKEDFSRLKPDPRGSENCPLDADADGSVSSFDMEVDASSSAAVSAAAIKDAMNRAQAKLKAAKVLMDKKKDSPQSGEVLGLKTDINDTERVHMGHYECASKDETLEASGYREPAKSKISGDNRHARSVSLVLPNSSAVEQRTGIAERKKEKKLSSVVDTAFTGQPGEWKEATQYYEFVNSDIASLHSQRTSNVDGKTAAGKQSDDDDKHSSDSADEACVPEENRRRLKAVKAVSRQEFYQKIVKVAQEVHESMIGGHPETEKGLGGVPQGNSKQQKGKLKKSKRQSQQVMNESITKEGDEIRLNAPEREEIKHKEIASCHSEHIGRNRGGLHQTRIEEAFESKDDERKMRGSSECLDSEGKMREPFLREGNEQRAKEAFETQRNDKKPAGTPKHKINNGSSEGKNNKCKEAFDAEFGGKVPETACQSQENDLMRDLLQRKVENNRKKEDCDNVVDAERLPKTRQSQKVEDDRSKEAVEDIFGGDKLERTLWNQQDAMDLDESRKYEVPEQEKLSQRLDDAQKFVYDNKKPEKNQKQETTDAGIEKSANGQVESESVLPVELEEACKVPDNSGDDGNLADGNRSQMKLDQIDEEQSSDSSPEIELPVKDGNLELPNGAKLNGNDIDLDDLGCDLKNPQMEDCDSLEVPVEENMELSSASSNKESMVKAVETADLTDERQMKTTVSEVDNGDRDQGRAVHAPDASVGVEEGHDPDAPHTRASSSTSGGVCTGKSQIMNDENKKFATSVFDTKLAKDLKIEREEKRNVQGEAEALCYKEEKVRSIPSEGICRGNEQLRKKEAVHTAMPERKESVQKRSELPSGGQSTETNAEIIMEEKRKENERDLELEQLRKLEEEKEREREREKDRMAVEIAIREARERAYADARDRAERAALERATDEARQRAMAEARERLEKACAEARERSQADKASEARLRVERAAVVQATAEARQRAIDKAKAERVTLEARERMQRSVSEKYSSEREAVMRQSSMPSMSDRYEDGEPVQRCKARLERHRRTVERVAKALAEKNMRDLIAQREQAERNRFAETLDADIKRWSSGKEGNLRALLSTLQYILGPDSGWQPIPLTEVITAAAVKKAYRKATLCVHPDKLQQRGASVQQKYICEKVFDLLKEAWNRFNSEEK